MSRNQMYIFVLDKLYLIFEKLFEHSTATQTLKKQAKVKVEDKTAKTNTVPRVDLMTSLEIKTQGCRSRAGVPRILS